MSTALSFAPPPFRLGGDPAAERGASRSKTKLQRETAPQVNWRPSYSPATAPHRSLGRQDPSTRLFGCIVAAKINSTAEAVWLFGEKKSAGAPQSIVYRLDLSDGKKLAEAVKTAPACEWPARARRRRITSTGPKILASRWRRRRAGGKACRHQTTLGPHSSSPPNALTRDHLCAISIQSVIGFA